ncbi:P-loop containing nucleoside triphosphate hydrolase protein [Clohesyomyces aquaticus]|uniref:p-loop containing nucleoside triphosphate hydrolase protein n=1 Tax=Clohesyomyces aquaticus TaxID=1231657 RepID=A0A1Y1Z1D9_9PLEO|nr:P-loop containing nucleoside triphosphate hydrolase protein [Clohesyomyces aquaticus]
MTKKGKETPSTPTGLGPSQENIGTTCELRIRQQRYDRSGNAEDVVVENLGANRGNGVDDPYAVVVNQHFTEKNRLEKEVVTINSEHILKAFRDVVKSHPTVAADFSEPFEMEGPYQMLYHYWDDLSAYRDETEDDVARMHMNLLFDFMEIAMGREKRRCEIQIKNCRIDFARLWTIYRPGDMQIRFEDGFPWLLKCTRTAYEENTREGKYFEVHCTYTDFDGEDIGEAKLITRIHQKRFFASEHPANIKDLPTYPRKYYQGDDLEKRMEERGAHFLELQSCCVRQYDGLASYHKEPPMDYWDPDMADFPNVWLPYKETGRIVIDRKTFQEDNNMSTVSIRSLSELDKMLCPPFVYGFSLAIKEWCRFYLPHIAEVAWNKQSMESLVLKSEQKALLQALVSSHPFPDNPRDQTKQKGKGLVILLHGSPGSGKTLTAECSAEITGRALLSTSLAELNKENCAWYFEYRLVRFLQWATIWKSIVLFDEADVFLETRKDDVADAANRNALVAVFLRHLEYFSGIVFLTTNRVEVFDEAMKSRIHLALGYHPPELEMRRTLWEKSLKAAIGGELDREFKEAVDVFIRTKLNGREISNAVHTAQTLARFEEKPLQLSHIETVLKVRHEFDLGLKRVASQLKGSSTSIGSVGSLVRHGSMLGAMAEEANDE